MEASIVANGTVRSGVWLRKNLKGVIIAADGGANTCLRHRIIPDYVIGDFDSVKKRTLAAFKRSATIVHTPEQSTTDLEKALRLAETLGAKRILVFGAIGTELDHMMANVFALTARSAIVDETHDIRIIEKRFAFSGKPNDIVSVIALTAVRGLTYTGLKWPVAGLSVPAGWVGIRNRLVGRKGSVSLRSGRIALIRFSA
ncbi:MAG: thiamine diphosphokinase [Patescibacteria group bacterium]